MMPFLVGHPNIVKQVFSRAWELVWDEIIFIRTCEIHLAFNHGMEIVSMCRYSLTKLKEIMGDKKWLEFVAVYAYTFFGRNSLVCLSLRLGLHVGPDGCCGSSNHLCCLLYKRPVCSILQYTQKPGPFL